MFRVRKSINLVGPVIVLKSNCKLYRALEYLLHNSMVELSEVNGMIITYFDF